MQDIPSHPESKLDHPGWDASDRLRLLLTLLGAGGMIAAAFLDWIRSIGALGVELGVRMLWNPNEPEVLLGAEIATVGFVALVLGVIALMGLWPRIRWLTSLAGAAGVAEATLFVVTAVRASGYEEAGNMTVGDLQVGVWALLAGGVLSFIAGFFGPRGRKPQVAAT